MDEGVFIQGPPVDEGVFIYRGHQWMRVSLYRGHHASQLSSDGNPGSNESSLTWL